MPKRKYGRLGADPRIVYYLMRLKQNFSGKQFDRLGRSTEKAQWIGLKAMALLPKSPLDVFAEMNREKK